jgi:cytochrome b
VADRSATFVGARTASVNVWDPLVRLSHWSLVVAFFAAQFFTDEGDPPHEIAGYVALGLVAMRTVWGFVGTPHARFAAFVPSPRRLFRYLGDMRAGREARHIGHNPAGGAMIVALLTLIAATSVSGWMLTTDTFWGAGWVENLHKFFAWGTLVLVAAHVMGVAHASVRHRENLVIAMISGRKRVRQSDVD